ncbi:hypothetical protein PHYPSEUDO_015481 [Phytophthora pseudosyringae]|uniref:Uncharacterized protein n=1 Tax=Phytophthora pseudosyringae TaxID=221518 RepID=A0A8T1W384_9STRA|nr:hypothetical protein PHYPSEUDO_015481 [Phytophthora pseudosyringae]
MSLWCTDRLGARDPTLRMARELVKLEATSPRNQEVDEDQVTDLTVHDGEFLPIVKEKLPTSSKIALMSVVTSADSSQNVHDLDANVLSLIFVFASTPEQPVVRWGKR